jgi:thiol-disulfide isomerase/thioredoxin
VTQTGSSPSRALLAGIIVMAAGVAGFVAYRHVDAPPDSKLEPVIASAAGAQPAAPAEAAAGEPKPPAKRIPDKLPDVTLANLEGKPTALASFAGRPLMVNFWATWCAPCRREIPLLNKIRMQRQAQNAEIVGIAVDFKDEVLAFVKKTPISYPLLMGEEDGLAAAEAFGMGMGLPFSVFVDSQNHILTIKVGELHEDEANFAFDRLRDIDNGVLTREAAQQLVTDAFREMAAERAKVEAAQAEHGAH